MFRVFINNEEIDNITTDFSLEMEIGTISVFEIGTYLQDFVSINSSFKIYKTVGNLIEENLIFDGIVVGQNDPNPNFGHFVFTTLEIAPISYRLQDILIYVSYSKLSFDEIIQNLYDNYFAPEGIKLGTIDPVTSDIFSINQIFNNNDTSNYKYLDYYGNKLVTTTELDVVTIQDIVELTEFSFTTPTQILWLSITATQIIIMFQSGGNQKIKAIDYQGNVTVTDQIVNISTQKFEVRNNLAFLLRFGGDLDIIEYEEISPGNLVLTTITTLPTIQTFVATRNFLIIDTNLIYDFAGVFLGNIVGDKVWINPENDEVITQSNDFFRTYNLPILTETSIEKFIGRTNAEDTYARNREFGVVVGSNTEFYSLYTGKILYSLGGESSSYFVFSKTFYSNISEVWQVEMGNLLIPEVQWNGVTGLDVLNTLMDIAGPYFWYVTLDGYFNFRKLDFGDTHNLNNFNTEILERSENRENLRTVEILQNTPITTTAHIVEKYVATEGQTTFVTGEKIAEDVSVTNNGVVQTIGVSNLEGETPITDVTFNYNSNEIKFSYELVSGDVVEITYIGLLYINFISTSPEKILEYSGYGGTGLIYKKGEPVHLSDEETNKKFLQERVIKNSEATKVFNFKIREKISEFIENIINIGDTVVSQYGEFVVKNKKLTISKELLSWNFECTNTIDFTNWIDFWRDTQNNNIQDLNKTEIVNQKILFDEVVEVEILKNQADFGYFNHTGEFSSGDFFCDNGFPQKGGT